MVREFKQRVKKPTHQAFSNGPRCKAFVSQKDREPALNPTTDRGGNLRFATEPASSLQTGFLVLHGMLQPLGLP